MAAGVIEDLGSVAGIIPLSLILLEYLALRMVTDSPCLDEAAQVELFRPEHGHLGRLMLLLGD